MKARADTSVRFGGRQTPRGYLFELTGGRLCLDLANTKDERPTDHPRELLRDYKDALDWAAQSSIISRNERRRLSERAAEDPPAASDALDRLLSAREAIFQVFSAIARQRVVPSAPLETLNDLIAEAFARRRLVRGRQKLEWAWRPTDRADLNLPLWAVVWSAVELLTSDDLARVRQCHGAGCAWLFIDTSKNGTRRWCDMSVCGNRAKARRHRSRLRGDPVP